MKCLFVGGFSDGKRIEVDERKPFYKVPIPPKVFTLTARYYPELELTLEIDQYHRMEFCGNEGPYQEQVVFLYAISGMTSGQVLRRLVDNYAGEASCK